MKLCSNFFFVVFERSFFFHSRALEQRQPRSCDEKIFVALASIIWVLREECGKLRLHNSSKALMRIDRIPPWRHSRVDAVEVFFILIRMELRNTHSMIQLFYTSLNWFFLFRGAQCAPAIVRSLSLAVLERFYANFSFSSVPQRFVFFWFLGEGLLLCLLFTWVSSE